MSNYQGVLIERLAEKKIIATFNGDYLNCKLKIMGTNGKPKYQRFSFVFDSADDCQGSHVFGKGRGTYYEVFQAQASEIIVDYSKEIAQEELV